MVIEKAELRRMSQAERRELAAMLAELEASHPDQTQVGQYRADPYRIDPVLRRERRLALLVSAACCVFLAGWIVLLAATLPHHFDAHHWRAVWVNFDVFLLAAFAATAWAIWRQRQVLILLLMLTGTMLCCDAWFDVGTSLATSGLWISVLSAVFAELPLAFLAFAGARRLLRATVAASILAGAATLAPRPLVSRPLALRRPVPSRPASGAGAARASPCDARRWPASASTRPCPAAAAGRAARRPDLPLVSPARPRRRMEM